MIAAIVISILSAGDLDEAQAERFAKLALACVQLEYPNKIAHVMNGPRDAKTPSQLTPAFYGCFDWHSAVHGHWLLARLVRAFPKASFAEAAKKALDKNLQPKRIAAEVAYLEAPGRVSFERPYGLAWLLTLALELREWDSPEAKRWSAALAPLEQLAAKRLASWLPKLSKPIRVGEHDQTAFALGLALDWARAAKDSSMESLFRERAHTYFANDVSCPIDYEPGGHDFLSPCLAEADLMRRIRPPEEFAAWLTRFLPAIPRDGKPWLAPEVVTDRKDPKLAHLDGLNLSRAFMLSGIILGLPPDDPRRVSLAGTAVRHQHAGLDSVTGEFYEGGHWLGSFATYLVTGRGL